MLRILLAVGTIFFVGLLHVSATQFDWYFYFWWYDVMMHTLGGVAMGFTGGALWYMLHSERPGSLREMLAQFLFVLGFVAMAGIVWEWAEAFVGSVPSLGMYQPGLIDTMLDLYFDLFGGMVAWLGVQVGELGRGEEEK